MSIGRSAELVERTIQEHADAYLIVAISPAGVPVIISRANNAAYCIALNAILSSILAQGGVAFKFDGTIDKDG